MARFPFRAFDVSGPLLGVEWIPSHVHPALFLGLGAAAAFIAGIGKAGFGSGIGIAAVPILVYACGGQSKLALGVMLPLLIACDYVSIICWWRRWDVQNLRFLIPGALTGVAIGSVVLWWISQLDGGARPAGGEPTTTDAILGLIIGGICVTFIVLQTIRAIRGSLIAFRPLMWQGLTVGAAAGLTSTLTHSAGPITGMYLIPQQMPKDRFVATTNLYFWIGNQAKLAPYLLLGLTNPQTLAYSVLLVPAVVIGALTGVFLHKRISDRWFTITIYALLTIAGGNLIYKSIRILLGR